MHNQPETILDSIIEELRAGSPFERVSEKYQNQIADLESILPILNTLAHLPKSDLPTPYKQHRYAQNLHPQSWGHYLLGLLRGSALPLGLLAGVSAFILTGFAANKSTPGEHLFTVKKSIERTTLVFTPENQKPQARLALVEKRLADAEQVLANPNSNPKNTQAALQELAIQTQETLSDVKKAADNDSLTESDVDVLNSLAEITKKQEILTSLIKPTTDSIAQTTAEVAKEAKLVSEDIQRIIATVNDKAIASLSSNPDDITIAGGIVSTIDQKKITVEKTVFNYDPATLIVMMNDQIFDITKLSPKSKITITGTKIDNILTARKIIVLELFESQPTGTVKGQTTTKTITPTEIQNNTTEPESLSPNNSVSGSFIPEAP